MKLRDHERALRVQCSESSRILLEKLEGYILEERGIINIKVCIAYVCVISSDIINNLIDFEDEQEELDSLKADKIYAGIQLSNKLEKHFLKMDTNSERCLKFQKELLVSSSDDSDFQLIHHNKMLALDYDE
ncbi:uncharacterized protein TNCV_3025991 [Trichonephila clavipes]|nr:uncharacterized protein TNCV_3025991 [Trichonephila clavipes]